MDQGEQRLEAMERLRVRRWRFQQFLALGFKDSDATALAEASVDLGLVRWLIGAGCSPETASRIVL